MEATIDLDRLFHSLEPEILNDPYIATLFKYIQHGTSFEDAIILTLKAMAARSKAEHDYLVTIIQNLPMSTIARR